MFTAQEIAKAVANEMCPTCEHIIECDFNNMKACGEIMAKRIVAEAQGEAKILKAEGHANVDGKW